MSLRIGEEPLARETGGMFIRKRFQLWTAVIFKDNKDFLVARLREKSPIFYSVISSLLVKSAPRQITLTPDEKRQRPIPIDAIKLMEQARAGTFSREMSKRKQRATSAV